MLTHQVGTELFSQLITLEGVVLKYPTEATSLLENLGKQDELGQRRAHSWAFRCRTPFNPKGLTVRSRSCLLAHAS